jgi:hypothetical protein
MVPGLNTLKKLLEALGYSLEVLDRTQAFIDLLRSQQVVPFSPLPEDHAALRREIGEVSAAAGQLASRIVRLMSRLLIQSMRGEKP